MPLKKRPSDPPADEADRRETTTLSRRSLLAASAGLAAAACTPKAEQEPEPVATSARLEDLRSVNEVLGFRGNAESELPTYFRQPSEMPVTELRGEKRIELNVDYLTQTFLRRDGAVVRGQIRAYNNHLPGPTISCDPGDKLSVTLRNNLPADTDFDYDYEGCKTELKEGGLSPAAAGLPHAFNTTNLHTHGLHVSPSSLCDGKVCGPPYDEPPTLASDDVFVEVPPGGQQDYCIVLPEFHAPGTHWYHAHKHGSTAIQVNNGLVGALIVNESGDNRILGDQPHRDEIFVMQEIMTVGDDQLVYAQEKKPESSTFLINGLPKPTVQTRTGEIQRWRFINGTSRPRGLTRLVLSKRGEERLRDTTDLPIPTDVGRHLDATPPAALEADPIRQRLLERVQTFERIARENAHPMYLIAVDGISRYGKPPLEVQEWDFAPGNRADFLVKFDEPGTYELSKLPHPQSGRNTPESQVLATIEVAAGSGEMQMPAVIPGSPPCYLDPITQTDGPAKEVTFQATSAGNWPNVCPEDPPWTCAGSKIDCDGQSRDCEPEGDDALLPRIFAMDCERFDPDDVETKYTMKLNTAEEWTLVNRDGGAHPFHIHVNPFQVIEIFDPNAEDPAQQLQKFSPEEATWQDVVAIPKPWDPNQHPDEDPNKKWEIPGYVKIRHRFRTFAGDYVIHCHFLNHEDLGMMKRVRVVPAADDPGHPPCEPVDEENCSGD